MSIVRFFLAVCICLSSHLSEKIEALIFEFDEVMVQKSGEESLQQAIARGFNVPEHFLNDIFYPAVCAVQKGEITEKQMWDQIEQMIGFPSPHNWKSLISDWYLANRKADPRMQTIVSRVSFFGYTTVLHSDTLPSISEASQQLGGYGAFDHVVLSHKIGHLKQDPEALLATLDLLGLSPKQCLYIDTSEENLAMAKSLGFDCIQFTSSLALKFELLRRQAAG